MVNYHQLNGESLNLNQKNLDLIRSQEFILVNDADTTLWPHSHLFG